MPRSSTARLRYAKHRTADAAIRSIVSGVGEHTWRQEIDRRSDTIENHVLLPVAHKQLTVRRWPHGPVATQGRAHRPRYSPMAKSLDGSVEPIHSCGGGCGAASPLGEPCASHVAVGCCDYERLDENSLVLPDEEEQNSYEEEQQPDHTENFCPRWSNSADGRSHFLFTTPLSVRGSGEGPSVSSFDSQCVVGGLVEIDVRANRTASQRCGGDFDALTLDWVAPQRFRISASLLLVRTSRAHRLVWFGCTAGSSFADGSPPQRRVNGRDGKETWLPLIVRPLDLDTRYVSGAVGPWRRRQLGDWRRQSCAHVTTSE